MPILVYGLNHRTAALDLRGRLSFSPEEIHPALVDLKEKVSDLTEAVILVTCNRTEIHGCAASESVEGIRDWFTENRDVKVNELDSSTFTLRDEQAVRHIIEVASGLDSQILGETQIHGQLKAAYQDAQQAGTLGKELLLVQEFTLQTAKRVRTETQINRKPASVASAAITMAKQIFTDISQAQILLIGAGSNIQLVSKYLASENAAHITYANRTTKNAQSLADEFGGSVIDLKDLQTHLSQFDIVVSSTASPNQILSRKDIKTAILNRRHKPIFFADLAVPRDIEASTNELNDIYLYTVDDLSDIAAKSLAERQSVLTEAREIIEDGLACYQQKRRIQLSASLLREYRSKVEQIRDAALDKARHKLSLGTPTDDVIGELASELVNQLAHTPTVALRKASALSDDQLLKLLQETYDLTSK